MSFAINNIFGGFFGQASKPAAQTPKATVAPVIGQDKLTLSPSAQGQISLNPPQPALNPMRQRAENLAQQQVDFDQQALDADKAALAKENQSHDPLIGFQQAFLKKAIAADQLKLDKDKLALETLKSQDLDQACMQDEEAVNNAKGAFGKAVAQFQLNQDVQAQKQMQIQLAKDTVNVDKEQVAADQDAVQAAQAQLDMWNSTGHTPGEFSQRNQMELALKEAQQRLAADKTQQQIDQQNLNSLTQPQWPIYYDLKQAS